MRKLKITDLHRLTVEEFHKVKKLPLIVVLDDIRSMHNIGSVFRTADAFRIEKVVLTGICSTPPNKEIHKTALGAEDSVAWEYFENCTDAVENLKKTGYIVISIEQVEGSISLEKFVIEPDARYALVLGNEVKGVDQAVVQASNYAIEIPQEGTKHSLNVSITAGIVMWEFFRRLAL